MIYVTFHFVSFALSKNENLVMNHNIINLALEKDIVISSLKVAVVVGCILNIINQGDILFNMNFENVNWFKLCLTFTVPYMVSTYASVRVKVSDY